MKRAATIQLTAERVRVEIEVELRERRSVSPHLSIDLDPITTYTELAICMVGSERVFKVWREKVSGQGRDYVLTHFGADARVVELCALWSSWHLNGLRAGHRHQRNLLRVNEQAVAELTRMSGHDRFSVESAFLAAREKNPYRDYTYGSAWLVEPLPAVVIERIEWLVTELGGKWIEVAA